MNDENRQARVAWKSRRNGESGFGEWTSKNNALMKTQWKVAIFGLG